MKWIVNYIIQNLPVDKEALNMDCKVACLFPRDFGKLEALLDTMRSSSAPRTVIG
jgi:hypothetical protein